MPDSRQNLEKRYKDLGNQLPMQYPNKRFLNHCYWRIALDNTVQNKWKDVVKAPAYKNLSDEQLHGAINLLETYQNDEALLAKHNLKSLEWRVRCLGD